MLPCKFLSPKASRTMTVLLTLLRTIIYVIYKCQTHPTQKTENVFENLSFGSFIVCPQYECILQNPIFLLA